MGKKPANTDPIIPPKAIVDPTHEDPSSSIPNPGANPIKLFKPKDSVKMSLDKAFLSLIWLKVHKVL